MSPDDLSTLLIFHEEKQQIIEALELTSTQQHPTYSFIGQYVDKEAIPTAQVHEGLSVCQTFFCALFRPQHLQRQRHRFNNRTTARHLIHVSENGGVTNVTAASPACHTS